MEDTTFSTGQIVQLKEVEDARRKDGLPGLKEPLQELIAHLREGGDTWPLEWSRIQSARCRALFCSWRMLGKPCGLARTEKQYFEQFPLLPEPAHPAGAYRHLMFLIPVEPRVTLGTLAEALRLRAGKEVIRKKLVCVDEAAERAEWKEPHWMWFQPGYWWERMTLAELRNKLQGTLECPLSLSEGLQVALHFGAPRLTEHLVCGRTITAERDLQVPAVGYDVGYPTFEIGLTSFPVTSRFEGIATRHAGAGEVTT